MTKQNEEFDEFCQPNHPRASICSDNYHKTNLEKIQQVTISEIQLESQESFEFSEILKAYRRTLVQLSAQAQNIRTSNEESLISQAIQLEQEFKIFIISSTNNQEIENKQRQDDFGAEVSKFSNNSLVIHNPDILKKKRQSSSADAGEIKGTVVRSLNTIHLLDPKDVLAKNIFSANFDVDSKKAKALFKVLTFLHVIGGILYVLSIWNAIERVYLYSVILTIPRFLVQWSIVNKTIFRLTITQPDVIIFNFWNIVANVTLLSMMSNQDYFPLIVIGQFKLMETLFGVAMSDALPHELRIHTRRFTVPIGIAFGTLWWLSLYFNWLNVNIDDRLDLFGDINISRSGIASSAIQNIIIFLLAQLVQSIRNPNHMVAITSPNEIVRLDAEKFCKIIDTSERYGFLNSRAPKNKKLTIVLSQ